MTVRRISFGLGITLLASLLAAAQAATPAPAPGTAEDVVRSLYALVSVRPGGPQTDWEQVRQLFHKDALIFLRTAPQATALFSVQGFIDDFIAFNQRARVQERGFSEKVVRLKTMVFGDIAHILVLYESSIPGSSRPPQQGVDSFQLIRKDGRWWILSVANEVPVRGTPIPKELER